MKIFFNKAKKICLDEKCKVAMRGEIITFARENPCRKHKSTLSYFKCQKKLFFAWINEKFKIKK